MKLRTLSFFAFAALAGCSAASPQEGQQGEDGFSSAIATQLDFELDGELTTDSTFNLRQKIQDQFLYTIGHLNGNRAVGRLDRLDLTNIRSTQQNGEVRVTYHARLPVAWGSKANLPTSYAFTLPRAITFQGLESFTNKYKDRCVDFSAHDVTSGSMWYYYRPNASGCALDANEVVKFTATVSRSTVNTTGKYPEYHKVWEDDQLNVVAIFGKNEENATSNDAGIDAFNAFAASMRSTLGSLQLTTEPATLPASPGVANPDIAFHATLADGKKVNVNVLLVDKIATTPPAFDARYAALSSNADVIIYNGHAGLGQNVRALARKGRFVPGKYLMLFMNGCDTFAYVDGYLAQTRAALNPDDPEGTKYMDIVTNGMPSYFHSNARASTAMVRGLMSTASPRTFDQIFGELDSSQVVLVTGEEDNAFRPGMPIGSGGGGGAGYTLDDRGQVARGQKLDWTTPDLDPGRYAVRIAHDPATPGGDADLYVRAGQAPTLSAYDCRPYKGGSEEECVVSLAARNRIFVSVYGYAAQSSFLVSIRSLGAPPPSGWAGLDQSGTVTKDQEARFETPELGAGTYVFELSGTGDADLYVRRGAAPTTAAFDCRPYENGSAETCTVTLTAPAKLHAMVRGYAASSTYRLVGRAQ